MKIHPYATQLLSDRRPFAEPHSPPALAAGSRWELVAATVGGILLGLLGLLYL